MGRCMSLQSYRALHRFSSIYRHDKIIIGLDLTSSYVWEAYSAEVLEEFYRY